MYEWQKAITLTHRLSNTCFVFCVWNDCRSFCKVHIIITSLPSLSQIYLSWKSGPAEVKHWKDMLARPRTNVAQWHALKAWLHHPASSMALSCLLFPPPLSSPPTPILMHKTDLLPGCETRVQLAICSRKPLNSFLFSFKISILLRLFSSSSFPSSHTAVS